MKKEKAKNQKLFRQFFKSMSLPKNAVTLGNKIWMPMLPFSSLVRLLSRGYKPNCIRGDNIMREKKGNSNL